jgi:hypothetical protein
MQEWGYQVKKVGSSFAEAESDAEDVELCDDE